MLLLKFAGLSLAVRPLFYTLLSGIVAKYKYTTLHTHFDSFQYTTMQAALGLNLWKRINYLDQKRVTNGLELIAIFKNQPGFKNVAIPAGAKVAFNQFPIVIDNLENRQSFITKLQEVGIETTTLYDHPLHHIFPRLNESGEDPYPNATYLAEHLFLIPPHAQINSKIIGKIRQIFDTFV